MFSKQNAAYFDVRHISDRRAAPGRKRRLHYPTERRPIISSVSCPAAVKNQSPPAASPVWPLSAPCVLTGRHEAESRLVSAVHNREDELARTLRDPPPHPTPPAPVGVRHEPNRGDPEDQL